MGMFDEVTVLYPMPDNMTGQVFQTKSLECMMYHYTITEDGRLIEHPEQFDFVPEEEREYYGTPEWDSNPIVQSFGMVKGTPLPDREIPYHGDIFVIGGNHPNYSEYRIRFTEGKVTSVIKLDN